MIIHNSSSRSHKLEGSFLEFPFKDSPNLDEDAKTCQICLDDYESGEKLWIIRCLHRFHSHCLERWIDAQQKCPICKTVIQDSVMDRFAD